MSFTINVLGSGSKGNAFVIGCNNLNIMVDAGFTRRELLRRMELCHIDPATIRAVLLTHEHDDHIKGARVFCNTFNIPLCLAPRTAEYLRKRDKLPNKTVLFSPGDLFNLAGFQVQSFRVSHDAVDPVGYVIRGQGDSVGVATDLGFVNTLVAEQLAGCSALLLESNYDLQMLRDSQRSYELKRRIMGNNGHLHNLDTIKALPQLITANTRFLVLTHISQECNRYDIVQSLAEQLLSELQRPDIELLVARQDEPSPSLRLPNRNADDLLEWANIG